MENEKINLVLQKVCENLQLYKKDIVNANKIDIQNAVNLRKSSSFIERLTISDKVFQSMLTSLLEVIKQPSPLNIVLKEWKVQHNGLNIKRISCPIGKILIIYESRPNVTLDAFSLCFKSGNRCILRGGSESFETSKKIVEIIHKSFDDMDLSIFKNCVEYIQEKDRSAMLSFLKKHNEIDLVIPRGGKNLIDFVINNTAIPVLRQLDGNCHVYIEKSAIPEEAIKVLVNSKMRRVSICGAAESLVIDEEFATQHLKQIADSMPMCEFFGCDKSIKIDGRIKKATEDDYKTEYSDAKISVKIVQNVNEAIDFINKYSSKHTESILSENSYAVEEFFAKIDSANIMHNVSTQFADGYEFGLGSEIGIATGKIHARGPVGLAELVIYKNIVTSKKYNCRP